METKKDKLAIIQTRISEKDLLNHKRERRKAIQRWVGKLRPLEKPVVPQTQKEKVIKFIEAYNHNLAFPLYQEKNGKLIKIKMPRLSKRAMKSLINLMA